jgi:hypothetical protein
MTTHLRRTEERRTSKARGMAAMRRLMMKIMSNPILILIMRSLTTTRSPVAATKMMTMKTYCLRYTPITKIQTRVLIQYSSDLTILTTARRRRQKARKIRNSSWVSIRSFVSSALHSFLDLASDDDSSPVIIAFTDDDDDGSSGSSKSKKPAKVSIALLPLSRSAADQDPYRFSHRIHQILE